MKKQNAFNSRMPGSLCHRKSLMNDIVIIIEGVTTVHMTNRDIVPTSYETMTCLTEKGEVNYVYEGNYLTDV